MKKYNIVITMVDGKVYEIPVLEDKLADRVKDAWSNGVKVSLTPTSWELLSPYRISTIIIVAKA